MSISERVVVDGVAAATKFAARVAAGRRGDREALSALLEEFRPYLLAIAIGELDDGLKGKVGASDLVQETLIEAVDGFGDFQGQGEDDLKGWLRRILRNNTIDLARRFRAEGKRDPGRETAGDAAMIGVADPALTPGAQAVEREDAAAVDAALAQLPEDDRAVILLRNRDHLSWDEAGRRLGRSGDAARKLWTRAIGRLQELLGDAPP